MDTVNGLLARVGLRKPQQQLTREQAMEARPVRNPALHWKLNDEDNVVIAIERRNDVPGKALGWLFMVPERRSITLDDVGSLVWINCDGENTVADLVTMLSSHLKVTRRETEVSLTEYLKTLGKRGMVGFMVDREVAEATGAVGQDVVGLESVAKTRNELEQVRQKTAAEAAETERIIEQMDADEPGTSDADEPGTNDAEKPAASDDEDDDSGEWKEGGSLVERVDDF